MPLYLSYWYAAWLFTVNIIVTVFDFLICTFIVFITISVCCTGRYLTPQTLENTNKILFDMYILPLFKIVNYSIAYYSPISTCLAVTSFVCSNNFNYFVLWDVLSLSCGVCFGKCDGIAVHIRRFLCFIGGHQFMVLVVYFNYQVWPLSKLTNTSNGIRYLFLMLHWWYGLLYCSVFSYIDCVIFYSARSVTIKIYVMSGDVGVLSYR